MHDEERSGRCQPKVGCAKPWRSRLVASNARVCRRLLALRQLALGCSIEQAAQAFALGVSQIYNWIHRYEAQGLEGMRDRPRCGAPQPACQSGEAAFVQRVLKALALTADWRPGAARTACGAARGV